jgi:cytoskeleton protein RodZ
MIEEQQALPPVSPGLILQAARQARNLSTQDVADKVRLKNSLIQDIEADNYDYNISLTFLKGYLKLYAREVGVNEAEVIAAFDSLNTQKKEPAKLQSFSKRLATQAHDDKLMLVTYLIVAVVIALAVMWWFQQSSSTSVANVVDLPQAADTAVTTNDADLLTNESNAVAAYELGTTNSESSAALDEPSELSLDSTNTEMTNTEPSELNSLPSDTIATTSSAAQPSLQSVPLVFTFASDCWMKLTDATGDDIAYGTKKQGRVMSVEGEPPFSVILCAPEVVQIDYDGQRVDLSGFRTNSTAKFTLPFSE